MVYGQYEKLAWFYDLLNRDVDYRGWCDFIEKAFKRFERTRTKLVLDLACGTGTISVELAKRGYDVIGVDLSAEMLSKAGEKAAEAGRDILFLNQNMCELDLYGTVDAAVCCLDSLNYLTDKESLVKCLSLVNNFMNDGGIFIFDVNTPKTFKETYGTNSYVLEDEGVLCAWQNDFDADSGICEFDLSIFVEREDGKYERYDETQYEKMYSDREIRQYLSECSFEILGVYSDHSFTEYSPDDERWFYVCRAKNKNTE